MHTIISRPPLPSPYYLLQQAVLVVVRLARQRAQTYQGLAQWYAQWYLQIYTVASNVCFKIEYVW